MKNILYVAVNVCAVVTLAGPASGDLIIDNFSETPQRVTAPPLVGEASIDEDALNPLEGVGETRYVQVERTSGPGQVSLTVDSVDNLGHYEAAVSARGRFTLGYDGTVDNVFAPNDATGLNLDLSGTDAISLFAVADFGAELIFTLYDGLDAYTATMNIPATLGLGSLEEYFLLYSAFTGPGTIDLTNIDAISIVSVPGIENARDVTFTLLQTRAIPEPSSMLMLAMCGIGFAGGALRRRCRKRAAA